MRVVACKRGLDVLCFAALVALVGCGGSKPDEDLETTPVKVEQKKTFDVNPYELAPIMKPSTEVSVPYLFRKKRNLDVSCFGPVEVAPPQDADVTTNAVVTKNSSWINVVLAKWFVSEIAPGLSLEQAKAFEIKPENLVMQEVPSGELKFVDNPECVSGESRGMKSGTLVVNTVVGARKISFIARQGIGFAAQNQIIEAAKNLNLTFEAPGYASYEPAVDEKGQPVVDGKGEQMFEGPGGINVKKVEVPPEAERILKSWSLSFEAPIFFAFRALDKKVLQSENKEGQCDVYLVWGDPTPRGTECPEYNASLFTASNKGGKITISIVTGDDKREIQTSYGDQTSLEINGRTILWLMPEEVEEGLRIRLDSLSIKDPSVAMDFTPQASQPAVSVPVKPVDAEKPPGLDSETTKEEAAPKEEKKAEEPKKKKKSSKPVSIDDYLR